MRQIALSTAELAESNKTELNTRDTSQHSI